MATNEIIKMKTDCIQLQMYLNCNLLRIYIVIVYFYFVNSSDQILAKDNSLITKYIFSKYSSKNHQCSEKIMLI